jgi:3-dehydroquinate dehydratase-2
MAKTVYVLNGPNLNLLGTREPEKYGRASLADVEKLCRASGKRNGFDIVFRQSNIEGELVNWIQEAAKKKAAGIVMNAAGYTTTSVSILDALLASKLPTIEVHITNIHARESFRHNSLISKVAKGLICGLGIQGYDFAIAALAGFSGGKAKK